jgi:hypothetical protein
MKRWLWLTVLLVSASFLIVKIVFVVLLNVRSAEVPFTNIIRLAI